MLNLLMFFIGITFIFLVARYNKSNKLFWILLLAMLSGFVGGTIANSFTEDDDKQVNVTISADNNMSMNTVDMLNATLPVIDVIEFAEINHLYVNTEYVNLYVFPSKSGAFKPRQLLDYVDTS